MTALRDVAVESPVGSLRITGDEAGLRSVGFLDASLKTRDHAIPGVLQVAVEEIRAYFAGELREFTVKLAPEGTEFQKRVWAELVKIPYGRTMTYGGVAKRLGDKKAVRAVGVANGQNPVAILVPCHRVIGANGDLTGYAGGMERKKWLLEHEAKFAPGPRQVDLGVF